MVRRVVCRDSPGFEKRAIFSRRSGIVSANELKADHIRQGDSHMACAPAATFIYIYAAISGHEFDVYGYANSVGPAAGAVKTRRHVGPPLSDTPPTYWRGEKIMSSRLGLASDLEALLKSVKDSRPSKWGGKVTIQVVDEATANEDRGGYNFPRNVIALLAELDCDLDIDVRSGDLV